MGQLRIKPTDEEIQVRGPYGYHRITDFTEKIFYGYELLRSEATTNRHIQFFDPSVKRKIEKDKKYRCWYKFSDSADTWDMTTNYYIVYIEEF